MNKKLLTLAVAAALAAPTMASAEAIIYGKLNVSLDYVEVNNVIRDLVNDQGQLIADANGIPLQVSQNFNGWDVSQSSGFLRSQFAPGAGPSNRFGLKGSEDLGNALKAVYQIEIGVNFDTNNNLVNNNDTFYFRNTFVGLASDWGTALIGRHDTPLKISTAKLDLFADTLADMNATVGFQDLRADSTVAYISPSWAGFQFSAALVPAGGATGFDTTAVYAQPSNFGLNSTSPSNTNINSDEINGAYSLAAIYKNGPFYASAAYEALGNEMFMNTNTSLNRTYDAVTDTVRANCQSNPNNGIANYSCANVDDDWTQWRIGLGLLDWNGFSLTGIYAQQDNIPTGQMWTQTGPDVPTEDRFFLPLGPDKVTQWQVQAGYAFGNNMIKAMYGQAGYEGDYIYAGSRQAWLTSYAQDAYEGDRSTWAVGFDHNFSKRTTAYILYTQVSDDQNDLPNISATVADGLLPNATRSDWSGFSLGLMHSF